MANLKLPFELEKPSSNEYVTQASEIGCDGQPLNEILNEVKRMSSVHEFAVSDDNGNNIITSDDGHLKTKNFDSRSVPAHIGNASNPHNVTKAQVGLSNVNNTSDKNKPLSDAAIAEFAKMPSNETSIHELAVGDENGGNIFVIDDGHIKTKNFDSEDMTERVEALEEGGSSDAGTEVEDSLHEFAIGDEEKGNILTIDGGHIRTKNFNSANVKQDANIQEVVTSWNLSYYLKENGDIDVTSALPETQVSDYIAFENNLFIEGGFIRPSQHNILACAYDSNHVKIASFYPDNYRLDLIVRNAYASISSVDNRELWSFLDLAQFTFDTGHNASEVRYLRVQATSTASPKIWRNYQVYFDNSPYKQTNIYGKNIAIFGGSFSVIQAGDVLRNLMRVRLNSQFVQTFGCGGAGYGWDSCWYKGYYSGSPVIVDGKVQWEQSVPKQVEWLISYAKNNNISIDYWILFFSTNDFNTHIKNKGSVDFTMSDLSDTSQYSNRDTQDGGLIYCINRIYAEFPMAKILVWGSMPFFNARYGYDLTDTTKPTANVIQEDGTTASRTQTNTYAEFIADQKAICEKYHIPYLMSMDIAQMNQFNYQQYYNPNDNYLHPLRPAYKIWSEYLIDFISKF